MLKQCVQTFSVHAILIAYSTLAIGPILLGMAKPVHVLQRGVDVSDIVNMAAIAVVDAQEARS